MINIRVFVCGRYGCARNNSLISVADHPSNDTSTSLRRRRSGNHQDPDEAQRKYSAKTRRGWSNQMLAHRMLLSTSARILNANVSKMRQGRIGLKLQTL